MSLIKPDDFAGRPYVGGLNQLGHVVAGAAAFAIAALVFPFWVAFAVSVVGILAIELSQFLKLNATAPDLLRDTVFWGVGVGGWAAATACNFAGWWVDDLPIVPVVAFFIEYARISLNGK